MIDRLKGISNWLRYTGLWLPPPVTVGIAVIMYYCYCPIDQILSVSMCVLLLSLVISLWIWSQNSIAKRNGLTEFPLIPYATDQNPYYQVSYRAKALYKKPDKRLLYKEPKGIILGKSDGRYMSIQPGITPGALHTLVLGTSGSGKTSSVLLSTLLAQHNNKEITFLAVDVKGELLEKGFSPDDKVAVFNPRRRDLYGFDFLYDLTPKSTESEVIEALRRVIYSLIPLRHTGGDEFWPIAARTVLLGLFLFAWEYQQCYTLPQLVDFALSKNLNTLITDILAEAEENSVVTRLLSSYGGDCVAEETLGSISSNIGNALADTPHYFIAEGELAVIPRLNISITEKSGFIIIKNDLLPKLQMTGDEILQIAKLNTSEQNLFEINSLLSVTMQAMEENGEDIADDFSEFFTENTPKTFVITNKDKKLGACCLACPEVIGTAIEKMGIDCYILPSSIHEVILIEKKGNFNEIEELRDMVNQVNRQSVPAAEILSDKVFVYNQKTKKIEIARTEQELQSMTQSAPHKSHGMHM